MVSRLAAALEQTQAAERRQATRALLSRPLLAARGPSEQDYRLVRRHEQALREWFAQHTGWRMTVDNAAARLHKRVLGTDPTRGIADGQRRPFSRRRYVLLALAFAVLERTSGQTTLGRLADDVLSELGDERFVASGIDFTLTGREERGDMVAVVRVLLGLGVLRRLEGDEAVFAASGADVLYDVDHGVLAAVPASAVAPSSVDADDFAGRIVAVIEQPIGGEGEARTRELRRSLTRRLLDDPVVYLHDLSDEERAYLQNQRRSITDRIAEATGLVAEIRAEGIAMVDPDDALSDLRMPEAGAPGHLVLLLATRLAADGRMSRGDLQRTVTGLQREHGAIWGSTIRARGAADLAAEAVARLRALALVVDDGEQVRALPALGRYRLGSPLVGGRG